MLYEKYDPLKNKMFSVLDSKGNVVNESFEPSLSDEQLINIYKTMKLARTADIKVIQYQRQGRMLTYAPGEGQEAVQTAAVAALEQRDWVVPSFRELSAFLAKGVSLKQIFTYWYGSEEGSRFPETVKILPVSIPIASQLNHATGLAMASLFQGLDEVTLAFVGEGGTSQGEFSEALNFAAVYGAPVVFIIQNNGYAISFPRDKQTKAKTLAQKAVGYGMPGIQVDGNDVLAVYAAVKEAVMNARNGKGPTLIEAVTYRLGPHTTSDNPDIYRPHEEVEKWEEKDPISRFRSYLINKGLWNDEQEKGLDAELTDEVVQAFNDVEKNTSVRLEEIFSYQYQEMPLNLKRQYESYKKYLEEDK